MAMRFAFLILLLAAVSAQASQTAARIRQEADRLMNILYLNPKAAGLPPYDLTKRGEMPGFGTKYNEVSKGKNSYIVDPQAARTAQSYYQPQCASPEWKPPEGCHDVCAAPPTYIWGGGGSYAQKDGHIELNPFRNAEYTQTLAHHPGFDCSGLVFAVYAMAGLKIDPDLPINEDSADKLTARSYMTNNKCFEPVEIGAASGLKAGDLIAWKSHIVIVDRAGADPFGVGAIASLDQCRAENIDPGKFNLVVMNSKGGSSPISDESMQAQTNPFIRSSMQRLNASRLTGVGVGVSKLNFADLAAGSPSVITELALAACRAKFKASPVTENVKIVRHKAVAQELKGQTLEPGNACLLKPSERIQTAGADCLAGGRRRTHPAASLAPAAQR